MLFLSTKNYLQAEHACVENDRFSFLFYCGHL